MISLSHSAKVIGSIELNFISGWWVICYVVEFN